MALIGLDIGTTGCKASVFDEAGHLIASASREYAVDIPHAGWAEQDAEHVWTLAKSALAESLTRSERPDISAIGLSVQGEAVMPVDGGGTALRPAILGMDTRTTRQNEWLVDRFGAEWLFKHTGMPVHTVNTLPKLLWLKENEPGLWADAARFLLYEDFIIHKMTGEAVISQCLASRTQLYDLGAGGWSDEILGALALGPERLARLTPSGTPVAKMHKALADELGFAEPPTIVTGGHDQACGALGVGLTEPGLAMVSTGTAEVVEAAMATPALNDTLYRGNISVYESTVPNVYVAMTLNHSGGLLLRWYRDVFCSEEVQDAHVSGEDAYDLILSGASPESTGLLVLPHFAGSGTPTFDTASQGAILGLTFGTTKTEIAKAILEGLTFELRLNLDLLKAGGVRITELRAIGGGARSELWLQLKADITGIPVVAPAVTEAAGRGAAILAGAGMGVYASAAGAAAQMVELVRRYEPDPRRASDYEELYDLYQKVYPATAPISHRLSQMS
jgi:xylulokinase